MQNRVGLLMTFMMWRLCPLEKPVSYVQWAVFVRAKALMGDQCSANQGRGQIFLGLLPMTVVKTALLGVYKLHLHASFVRVEGSIQAPLRRLLYRQSTIVILVPLDDSLMITPQMTKSISCASIVSLERVMFPAKSHVKCALQA